MLNIQITKNIRIIADDKNYIVQKRNKIKNDGFGKGAKVGQWTNWRDDGYFQDWDYLMQEMLHLKIRRSDAKTLEEVVSTIREWKTPKMLF